MLRTFLLVILFGITANTQAQKVPYIDEKLKPFVYDFMLDLLSNNLLPKAFDEIDSIVITPPNRVICGDTIFNGCAEWNYYPKKNIKQRRVFLQAYTPKDTVPESKYYKYLIYHELGHALFDLEHQDNGLSLMNTYSDDNQYASKDWNRLHSDYINSIKRLVIK